MSFQNVRGITYKSGAAIPQARFVALNAGGAVTQDSATAPDTIGVSLNATPVPYTAGDVLSVAAMDGCQLEVEAGAGGLTDGDAVTAAANGLAVTAVATNQILGFADGDAAAGEFATITLLKSGLAV